MALLTQQIEKIVVLGSPSDFKIILQNYIALLSLNYKISKALEDHYLENLKINLENFITGYYLWNFIGIGSNFLVYHQKC